MPITRALSALRILGWMTMTLLPTLTQSAGRETTQTIAQQNILPNAAYMQPIAGLSPDELARFLEGEKAFQTSWVVFPQLDIPNWDYMRPLPMFEWGLGPTFLANSCAACHVQAGRGRTTETHNAPVFQQLLRLSVPGDTPNGGPKPDPAYGNQLQIFDVLTKDRNDIRQGEADLFIDWQLHTATLVDGTKVELRKPIIRIENLNFGPLGDGVMSSLRNSRVIFGLGYLEAVAEKDLQIIIEAQKAQGLNGRINYVYDDVNNRRSVGRLGWKANQPNVRQQIAAAFHGDMGITSTVYPKQNCPETQTACKRMLPGDKVELRDTMLNALNFWVLALDAPAPRDQDKPQIQHGRQLFNQARCAQCHLPELRTSDFPELPALSNRRFQAYTDMLIHDMGDGLADGRPDFQAGARDWRTPPLWGLGLSTKVNGSTHLLHDGRARSVLEAILWHGGEAQAARELFTQLSTAERDALIAFINSL